MQKPHHQFNKDRRRHFQPTEGQWRFSAAALSIIAAVIQFLNNHLK